MKCILFSTILIFILMSCLSTKPRVKSYQKPYKNYSLKKSLLFFTYDKKEYDSTLSIRTNYVSMFSLKFEYNKKSLKIFHQNNIIYQNHSPNNSYLTEMFDSSFLILSYFNGINSASSPDLVQRDTVFIYDLKKFSYARVCLPKINLTRSKDFMIVDYRTIGHEELKLRKTYMAIIDSVDFLKKQIILINQALEIEKHNFIE